MMHNSQARAMKSLGVFIVTLAAAFYFYEYFLRIFPSVMKPELMSTFHLNATLFGTLSAYYFYAYTPMQLIVGLVVDRFNLRIVLTFAIICCFLGTFLIATSHSYDLAILGRFLQGFGSAFAFVGSLKLAAIWLPAERFGFFSGACAALGFLGGGLGEILLTEMVQIEGWRTSLLMFAWVGLALALALWIMLRFKPKRDHIKHSAENSRSTFQALLPQLIEIVKHRRVWVAGLLSSLMFLPTSVFAALWGIPYLQKFHDYTNTEAAIATAMIFIGWAIGAPLGGLISDYFRNRVKVIMFGALAASILSLIVLYSPTLPYFYLCVLFIFFGISSSTQVLTFAMARDVCSPTITGSAVAFINCLCMLGGMIFQRGLGEILDWSWSGELLHGERIYRISDYQHAVTIIPICLILATIVAFFTKSLKPKPRIS